MRMLLRKNVVCTKKKGKERSSSSSSALSSVSRLLVTSFIFNMSSQVLFFRWFGWPKSRLGEGVIHLETYRRRRSMVIAIMIMLMLMLTWWPLTKHIYTGQIMPKVYETSKCWERSWKPVFFSKLFYYNVTG